MTSPVERGHKFAIRAFLRRRADALVGLLPRWFFRAFLKTFLTRPELAETVGFHVHPRRFDSPLVVPEEVEIDKLSQRRSLPGIDLRVPSALETIKQLKTFAAELDPIPFEPDGKSIYWLGNTSFPDFDSAVLHTLLRFIKPKRYIELGCGFSSFISSRALRRNQEEGTACEAFYCDPEPRLDMADILVYGKLLKKRVQDLPLEMFTKLQAGDVLFIDTSHVLKLQSDVEQELLRILPSLARGVWIHIHDVFTPYDYPGDWVSKKIRHTMNEQYAVECLLTGGERYEIEIPLHCLVREYLPEMQQFFPRGKNAGQSLWMRKVQ